MHLLVRGGPGRLAGDIRVPASKYHAHRALILASLADGVSRVNGLTEARHVTYTVELLRGLGVRITTEGDTFVVHGLGGVYRPRRASVSAGSSGTTLYFMIGLAALADRPVEVTGQKYFRRRPVGPLLDALRQLGVHLTSADGCPPVQVRPGRPAGGHVRIPGTLSQWISGLILLAPFAERPTVVEVEGELNERPYLELTVAMMRQFGLRVEVSQDWRRFAVEPGQRARARDVTLPPDIGSAAFAVAAAALHPADVLLRGITSLDGGPADHPEAHFLRVARDMGVPMEIEPGRGLRVRHDGVRLRGTTVDCRDMPDMLPVLATLATFADGETVFEHVAHTRLKESDRAAAMTQLNAMGAGLALTGDTLRVRGTAALRGAKLSSFNDHRVLMALAVAATRADGPSTLSYPHAYRISYPDFLTDLGGLGLSMAVERPPARTAPAAPAVAAPAAAGELPAAAPASPRTLPERVREHARTRPDETAVVTAYPDHETALTWRELAAEVDRAAALLLRLGVAPGERVAYQLPNQEEFVVMTLAALRIGAVCCPVMPFFREREVGFALRRSGARVLLLAETYRGRRPAEELAGLPAEDTARLEHVLVLSDSEESARLPGTDGAFRFHDWHAALAAGEADAAGLDARTPEPTALAQLLFTSGTSGEPKGALHRGDVLARAAAAEIRQLGLDESDVVWVPSPLAHQTGFLYGMWLALELGVRQVLQAEWDAKRALSVLREHRATFVQASTPFLSDLVQVVEGSGQAPPVLRVFVAAGTAIPRSLAERASRVMGTAVCGAFGTTETCLATLSTPADAPAARWGTDGRALDGVRLRVVDDAGRVRPPGVEGNFEIRTPTAFAGYLDRPDLTADAFTEDGWYRTGDLATLDADGYLSITGRVKDVINRGGEKVPVSEIEQLLHAHPAVAEAALVAMPDERLGERVCAFVAVREGDRLDFPSMQRYLDQGRVARHYWPERLEVVDSLPRNAAGKVQKFVLRDRARSLAPQRGRRVETEQEKVGGA
ncbi:3-phosphoshikimate 1-carboxyvinyltransferase [Streptomyces ardesiacus]|uniref:3-phosphoshikimate 1-carboxyvinyltransferase n=1 Tax=Streptomyces ardesiacus TaxID=285564 RepID=UPI00201F9C7E|nr:3-phosphoshikimate 1-carboxyvinyltransferase [Streptomyces ardesiacus]MCL7370291.1 3-phosphoshikimate 1-carboxyvinyltransferase [Streptomyces ardesiacus]